MYHSNNGAHAQYAPKETIIKPRKLIKPKTYIFYNANVFDVLSGEVHDNVSVRLSGGNSNLSQGLRHYFRTRG
jgi:hypothetical protein